MSFLINPFRFRATTPFSAVVFLSGFEGADTSTSFTDESSFGHAITANGNAQVDTAQFKFGSSSLLLDGSGDFVTCADSADFEMGAGAFTVEAWIRINSLSNGTRQRAGIVGHGQLNSGNLSWSLHLENTPSAGLIFDMSSTGGAVSASVQAAFTFSLATWYHVAVDRDAGGVVRLYINGTMVASTTYSGTLLNTTNVLEIGRTSIASFNRDFDGWIDEVRVTKGYAQYGSDAGFTAPTAAFPRS